MARTKRETLKFIRIRTRPFYLPTGGSDKKVTGHLNIFNEFSRWDIEYIQNRGLTSGESENFTVNGSVSPSPRNFFTMSKEIDEYTKMAFVIDGIHKPYDRSIHNLSNLSAQIYIQRSDAEVENWLSKEGSVYEGTLVSEEDQYSLVFRINPNNIKIVKKKLFKKIRTRGGWVFQHWGPEIGSINIAGTTGNISPDVDAVFQTQTVSTGGVTTLDTERSLDQRPSEFNSPALAAFRAIEKWYDADQSDRAIDRGYLTALQFRNRIYVGHLADFSFEEKGDQPFQLFYTLTFLVHYDATNLSSATGRASNQIVRNEETLALVRQLKGN